MCGITGWVDWDRDLRTDREIVERMTDSMWRRGPDASDVWVSEHAALGHRRLAVIDVEGGLQPMAAFGADGVLDAVITYSGEVYNFAELRTDLIGLGHVFRTASDTEVVLQGYRQWGEGLASLLNGMFAFAVWDARQDELLLVRDRLGVKPLYYRVGSGHLLFGSEPKAVLSNPLFDAAVDLEGIAELFAVPAAPTPGNGVYKELRELLPGCWLKYSRAGARLGRYWALEALPHMDGVDDTVRTVRALLDDSVGRQLVSDVPLGLLLSGGLDSSTLTGIAAALQAPGCDGLATFSVVFPPDESPEVMGEWNRTSDEPYVRCMVESFGTRHTDVVVTGDRILENRAIGLRARDLPGWGEPDSSLYILFSGIRRHSTVVLSGEVADEAFGGYPYFFDPRQDCIETFPWLRHKLPPAHLLRDDVRSCVRPDDYGRQRVRDAVAEVPRLLGEPIPQRRFRETSYLALTRWLPALLARKDRMSMAAGLEVRVPFADHRLIEYLWNTPRSIRALNGSPKGLLRVAMRDMLPDRVLNRPKSGYPASSSPRYGSVLRAQVDRLLQEDARVFELVDRNKVRVMLEKGEVLPGPRAAPHPTGGLEYLLSMNSWLTDYKVALP